MLRVYLLRGRGLVVVSDAERVGDGPDLGSLARRVVGRRQQQHGRLVVVLIVVRLWREV